MGYDMKIVVLKKKTLEEAKRMLPDYTFSDIYSNFLFSRLYPDEYEFAEDEEGRIISDACTNIFKGFFDPELKNDEAIIIDEDKYYEMIAWLEKELSSKTLLDLVCTDGGNVFMLKEMMDVYKQMKVMRINFSTEFVVYCHDW